MHAQVFARAVHSLRREQDLTEAFRHLVDLYYEDYTDATELDGEFEAALKACWDRAFGADNEDADGRTFDAAAARPEGGR